MTETMNREQLVESTLALLKTTLRETGADLAAGAEELATYTAARAQHLAGLVGDPNFQEALRAEADTAFLHAGLTAARKGDAADARMLGLLHGVLAIGAQALAAVV